MKGSQEMPTVEFQLIHRHNVVYEEVRLSKETSLYFSAITGGHFLEQVMSGPNFKDKGLVSLTAEMVAGLLPHLQKIADG